MDLSEPISPSPSPTPATCPGRLRRLESARPYTSSYTLPQTTLRRRQQPRIYDWIRISRKSEICLQFHKPDMEKMAMQGAFCRDPEGWESDADIATFATLLMCAAANRMGPSITNPLGLYTLFRRRSHRCCKHRATHLGVGMATYAPAKKTISHIIGLELLGEAGMLMESRWCNSGC